MLAKRALVVDDSKSARAFLTRLLQEQQLEVDAVETGEQAIDYLTNHRPDVIFMDHLMPGMDGFQAVQAIKANPRTALIPILMYTSQEGELYLGQVRALGAVGVLPKSASPADVRELLQQLQLVPALEQPAAAPVPRERPDRAATAEPVRATALPELAGSPVDEVVKEEVAALRRHLTEVLDAQGKQVVREVRGLIREAAAAAAAPAPTPAPRLEPPVILPEKPRHSPVPWFLALAAGVAAAVFGTLWWQGQQQMNALRTDLMDSRSTVTMLTARLGPAPQAGDAAAAQPLEPLVLKAPFGEAPLSGARVAALREFVGQVAALGQKGTVDVRRYAGRFCFVGSSGAGYSLADGAMPASKCDLVAEATDAALGNVAAESAGFNSALAELRKQYGTLLTIEVGVAHGEVSGNAYPETGGVPSRTATAGEWNAAAAGNNRVEIRWHPAP